MTIEVEDSFTISSGALYKLMSWLSPSFPVGAYAYSHGIEFAVEAGRVNSESGLADWIDGILIFGAGRNDAIFFAETWRAAAGVNDHDLLGVAALANAYRGSRELALENEAQGAAFLAAVEAAWPSPELGRRAALLRDENKPVSYPVAVALAAALAGVPVGQALTAYLHAFAANLVSAGVRLVPLGQTAGQRILAGLQETVLEAAALGENRTLDDLGSASAVVDWTSAQHETQYTRLFRS